MTEQTTNFFMTGWDHIVAITAYDHLLFVTTLCAAYRLVQWRQVLIIITAFTVGHSGTLILSALELIQMNNQLVGVLIPLTIMLTALVNVMSGGEESGAKGTLLKYGFALGFGLIHGLAFAEEIKSQLAYSEESVLWPLFLFNVGIEVGQIFIVALFMIALWLYSKFLNGEHLKWKLFVSGAGFGGATHVLLQALVEWDKAAWIIG